MARCLFGATPNMRRGNGSRGRGRGGAPASEETALAKLKTEDAVARNEFTDMFDEETEGDEKQSEAEGSDDNGSGEDDGDDDGAEEHLEC